MNLFGKHKESNLHSEVMVLPGMGCFLRLERIKLGAVGASPDGDPKEGCHGVSPYSNRHANEGVHLCGANYFRMFHVFWHLHYIYIHTFTMFIMYLTLFECLVEMITDHQLSHHNFEDSQWFLFVLGCQLLFPNNPAANHSQSKRPVKINHECKQNLNITV